MALCVAPATALSTFSNPVTFVAFTALLSTIPSCPFALFPKTYISPFFESNKFVYLPALISYVSSA